MMGSTLRKHVSFLVALLLCTPMVLVAQTAQDSARPTKATIDEFTMRKSVKVHRLPQYPRSALQRRAQGVVVVEILTTTTGAVESVSTLESPDPEITEAVEAAVRSWEFNRFKAGVGAQARPARIRTKLTFYFRIDAAGRGTVTEPTLPSAAGQKPGAFLAIDETTARKLARDGALVIDLTERGRAPVGSVEGARSMPLDELSSRTPELPVGKIIVMLCPAGLDVVCRAMGSSVADQGREVRMVYK